MYVFSIGFLVIRALADGETLLEKAGLALVVLVIAFAMFPLCKPCPGGYPSGSQNIVNTVQNVIAICPYDIKFVRTANFIFNPSSSRG